MDFSELYRTHARDVYRFALFLCGNQALAEDLTAETFARAFAGRGTLRLDTVKGYLLAIARNLYRDLLRRDGRFVDLGDVPETPDQAPGPDVATEDRLRLERAFEALRQLPEAEREALALVADTNLPYSQIAVILHCSVPALKVRVHRARTRLKSLLEKEHK